MEFTKEDHEAISAAVRKAEKRTCGQIVCVLAHSSSDYTYVPILWASVLALLIPWPLIDFTQLTVQRIFLLQLVVFILAGFIFSWMPLRLTLVPPALRRARAHRAALEQFVVRHVTHTHNRCGILIFVSMAEHYARVIADEGIAQEGGRRRVADRDRCADRQHSRRPDRRRFRCRNRALWGCTCRESSTRRLRQRIAGPAVRNVAG